MKRIKKFNELFDTEDLKSRMEIDYLSDNIPLKSIIKSTEINGKLYTDLDRMHFKLITHFEFFEACLKNFRTSYISEHKGYYVYNFKNMDWTCQFSIKEENNKYITLITFRKTSTTVSDFTIGFNNFIADRPCLEYLQDVTFDDVKTFIKARLIPLMKALNMNAYLSYKIEGESKKRLLN